VLRRYAGQMRLHHRPMRWEQFTDAVPATGRASAAIEVVQKPALVNGPTKTTDPHPEVPREAPSPAAVI
jgi:hypothetical protein